MPLPSASALEAGTRVAAVMLTGIVRLDSQYATGLEEHAAAWMILPGFKSYLDALPKIPTLHGVRQSVESVVFASTCKSFPQIVADLRGMSREMLASINMEYEWLHPAAADLQAGQQGKTKVQSVLDSAFGVELLFTLPLAACSKLGKGLHRLRVLLIDLLLKVCVCGSVAYV